MNHGYVVFDINNRGSSGYGKTFFSLDDRKHGEADLGDVVACRQMLIDTGYVDANKIGIIGGSYGGYMVLAALTLQPDAFKAGVDIFGISNWVRNPFQHAALVGIISRGAVCGDGRSGNGQRPTAADLTPVPCRKDQSPADGPARGE